MRNVKRLMIVLVGILLSLLFCACSLIKIPIAGTSYPTTPDDTTTQENSPESSASDLSANPEGFAYRNDYFKLACTLPDDWYVLNQQEIIQFFGFIDDLSSKSETVEQVQGVVEGAQAHYDFYAMTTDGMTTINAIASSITVLDFLSSEQRTIEESIPLFLKTMEELGIENQTTSTDNIQFCGEKHVVLNVQWEFNGMIMYEKSLFIRRGFSILAISVASYSADKTDDILGYWSKLK